MIQSAMSFPRRMRKKAHWRPCGSNCWSYNAMSSGPRSPTPTAPSSPYAPKRRGRPPTVRSIPPDPAPRPRKCLVGGYRRIQGESVTLGIAVAASTVREIRREHGTPPACPNVRARRVMDLGATSGRARFLIRDRKFTAAFDALLAEAGPKVVTTSIQRTPTDLPTTTEQTVQFPGPFMVPYHPRMAQKIVTLFTDDLTGEEATEVDTYTLLLNGVGVELDLTPESHGKLLEALSPFLKAEGARRVRSAASGTGIKDRRRSEGPSGNKDAAKIRAWAKDNGYEVNDRGRMPASVVEAYEKAK